MSEKLENKTVFSLLEVMKSIQKTLHNRYTSAFWVKAEMNKLHHYTHSGHCYPELVEKQKGKVIAQTKAILWKSDYQNINRNFLKVLNEPLKDEIKILFLATISFDPLYGLSLRIIDIDPAYTLGDLEKEKQQTIDKLKGEGIFNRNKTLPFPMLPQRIAIISVETSKGYADFLKIIEGNNWNYAFFHLLFPSLLQGERATHSIIRQLERIRMVRDHFDVVAIIRGGGGEVGLSCYNDYRLAREIALFPIPVITGIGHATNETAVEMISYTNAITPTKIAEYLIQKSHDFSVPMQEAERKIREYSKRMIGDEKLRLQTEVKLFRSVTENIIHHNQNKVNRLSEWLFHRTGYFFKNEGQTVDQLREKIYNQSFLLLKNEKITLNNLEKNIHNMSPLNVLKRGYSVTRINNKAIINPDQVKEGDSIETLLFKGKLHSIVKTAKKNNNK